MPVKKKLDNTTDIAQQLYSQLTSSVKKTEPKKSVEKRPAMQLSATEEQTFSRFASAYAVAKEVEARRDNEKASLNALCLDKWIADLWKSKKRPPTQFIAINRDNKPDISANFIVSDKYTINTPSAKDDETLAEAFTRTLVDLFVNTGLEENKAEAAAVSLINNELDLAKRPHIDLFKWLVGHYEGEGENKVFKEATDVEKALGVKLLTNLQCQDSGNFVPLTQEELSLVVEMKNYIEVKKGFLDRICSYVSSIDQLKAVFTVIKPIVWPGQVKFGINDNPTERNSRMWMEAKDILGVENETNEEIELAQQALADFFYPRKIYNPPCEDCGGDKVHLHACKMGRTIFQGWQGFVKKTNEIIGVCDTKDCENQATKRIRLNIWGSLYEFDVCETHAVLDDGRSRDGLWCDSL